MPEERWTEVIQEAVNKTNLKKKKCKNAKWFSKEALPIAEKRREAKGKGEKERYTHLNTVFQRIVESLPSDQCKEIEKRDLVEKTRNLFQKTRDTKGTLHAKERKRKVKSLSHV